MIESSDKKKLKVRIELDTATNQWVASVTQPKRLVDRGLEQASGADAGQARNRLVTQVEQLYPHTYDFEDDFIPPPALAERVTRYATAAAEKNRLVEWLREERIPLALALQQQRVPQNIIAVVLDVTPTYLGQELKKHGTAPTGTTGKVPTGRKTGKVSLE